MITIHIPESKDLWDSVSESFVDGPAYTLQMEHSLISLQAWEAIHHKPFMSSDKTESEMLDYFKCMTINSKTIPDEAYRRIPISEMKRLNDYIKDPMTATKFYDLVNRKNKGKKQSGPITAEKIYYWMISCNIPSEYRKWHLNQLMTLIQVFDVEGDTNNKMSPNESREWQRAQNAARRKKYNTKG